MKTWKRRCPKWNWWKTIHGCKNENKKIQKVWRLEKGYCPGSLNSNGNQGLNTYIEDRLNIYNWGRADQTNIWRREDYYDCYMHMGDSQRSTHNSGRFSLDDLLSRILYKVEGSNKMLNEMKDDFPSFNNKVNSQLVSIKKLKCQMTQLSCLLKSKLHHRFANDLMVNSNINHCKYIVFNWIGKALGGNVKVNGEVNTSKEGYDLICVEGSNQEP